MKAGSLPKPARVPVESEAWKRLEAVLVAGIREYLEREAEGRK